MKIGSEKMDTILLKEVINESSVVSANVPMDRLQETFSAIVKRETGFNVPINLDFDEDTESYKPLSTTITLNP